MKEFPERLRVVTFCSDTKLLGRKFNAPFPIVIEVKLCIFDTCSGVRAHKKLEMELKDELLESRVRMTNLEISKYFGVARTRFGVSFGVLQGAWVLFYKIG